MRVSKDGCAPRSPARYPCCSNRPAGVGRAILAPTIAGHADPYTLLDPLVRLGQDPQILEGAYARAFADEAVLRELVALGTDKPGPGLTSAACAAVLRTCAVPGAQALPPTADAAGDGHRGALARSRGPRLAFRTGRTTMNRPALLHLRLSLVRTVSLTAMCVGLATAADPAAALAAWSPLAADREQVADEEHLPLVEDRVSPYLQGWLMGASARRFESRSSYR